MKRRERKHKFKKEKRNWFPKINIFKALSIFLVVLFILSIPAVIKKLIKIDKIECQSQFGECDEGIVSSVTVTGNYRDVKKIIEKRLDGNVRVRSYLIQYKIPKTLKIDLSLTKPKYAINVDGKFYLIDRNGLILEIRTESNLPTLIKNNLNYSIGEKITEKDKFALGITEKVAYLYSVKSGMVGNNELQITTNEGILIHFPLEGDIDVLIGSLRLIFSRLNASEEGIRMVDVHEIDLRFKNPIIR